MLSRISILVSACLALSLQPAYGQDGVDFFERKIRPVLVQECYSCHSAQAKKHKGGLVVDTKQGLLAGGDTGPAIVPGKPNESLLIKALQQTDASLKMPPGKKLSDPEIALIAQWIAMGAPWGGAASLTVEAPAKKYWAFVPPKGPALPHVKNASWVKSPIDAFVLAGLEEKNLTPAPPAGKRELIRRAKPQT